MLALFSLTDSSFDPFTFEHFAPILLAILIGIGSVYVANIFLSERAKTILGSCLALFPFFCVIGRLGYLISIDLLDPKEDLPFFLCRFMALILPFVFYTRNRFFLGILYFWILAGTINAIITPDLLFPPWHWEYTLYWIYHLMLMVTMFYGVFVYRLEITWKDYWNAVLCTIAFTVFSALVNYLLEANYNYLSHKPSVASILDLMGPWPWYIVNVYGLMFFLFFIALIPYLRMKKV